MAKEPARTCIGCRKVAEKRELVRIVRNDGGLLVVDARSCAPGRGAYLHPRTGCVDSAMRSKAFARAFKAPVEGLNDMNKTICAATINSTVQINSTVTINSSTC